MLLLSHIQRLRLIYIHIILFALLLHLPGYYNYIFYIKFLQCTKLHGSEREEGVMERHRGCCWCAGCGN